MQATVWRRIAPLVALAMLALRPLGSQSQPAVIDSSTVAAFAAAHAEVSAVRGKAQAELAEPKAKKAEVQVAIREQLHQTTDRILKAHNLTEAEFTRLTRQVSTDDALRKRFEEALARLAQPGGG